MEKRIRKIDPVNCMLALFGSSLLAFGLYNVHSLSGVTEGGVLGMTLLLEHCFDISPAITGFFLNLFCYVLGWKMMGKKFLFYSGVSTVGFSGAYKICEQFEPMWPELTDKPLAAAVIGALFVGISAGICVRVGGAPSGDDALAMSMAKGFHMDIRWAYLLSDLVVLALSLSYIPFKRIGYSLLTVILSGQMIGLVQKIRLPGSKKVSSREQASISDSEKDRESDNKTDIESDNKTDIGSERV